MLQSVAACFFAFSRILTDEFLICSLQVSTMLGSRVVMCVCVAVCCRMLQCVAVCCSVLQCVPVSCSEMQ